MKQRLVKIASVFMLAVFLYGTLPHEYLHDLFAHHQDTIDHVYKKGEYHISARHVHCSFLGVAFGSFLAAGGIYHLFEIKSYRLPASVRVVSTYVQQAAHVFCLRGPPVAL